MLDISLHNGFEPDGSLNTKKIKITTDRDVEKNLFANTDKINRLGWSSKQNINEVLKDYLKNKRN